MSDTPQTEDAREADDMGERPDLGRTPDALIDQLTGTDSGSDTRAGSLRGGSATGSDDDPDQAAINESLATEGMTDAAAARGADGPPPPPAAGSAARDAGAVRNTGVAPGETDAPPPEGRRDADAATG